MSARHTLSEADVTDQIVDWLEWRGWRLIRQQSGGYRNPKKKYYSFGEPGIADWLAIFYLPESSAKVFWLEMKSPEGSKRKCDGRCVFRTRNHKPCTNCAQRNWAISEEQRGATVIRGCGLAAFQDWYCEKFGWLHDPATAPKRGIQTWMPLTATGP